MLKSINTNKSPKAIGPYSQAIIAGDFIFVSGTLGLNPKDNSINYENIEQEVTQVLTNLENILKSVTLDFSSVVKTDIFLTDMNNFNTINRIYESFFKFDPRPSRATVEVSNLPKGANVEISLIAYKKNG